jgi:hypothetical protein
MEQRTGRLSAFFQSGPVQFVGAAGLAIALGVGFNATLENADGGAERTTKTADSEHSRLTSTTPLVDATTDATTNTAPYAAPNSYDPTGENAQPVAKAVEATRMETPYVPQDAGTAVYAFTKGMYDWQTFAARSNDIAPNVTSDYADDYIRALPTAADRATVLGTGPHKLLQDPQGGALSPIYLGQHYHLGAEGLAVAVSDNPAYAESPIRTVAGNAVLLAQAGAIGQNPDALRALIQEVHTTRMGVDKAADLHSTVHQMDKTDMATYALIAGETAYVMAGVNGDTKSQEQAALLVMAGAEAHYQSTRTHGKFHDMPLTTEWTEQIASATSVARFAKMEAAKVAGVFKGLTTPEAPLVVAQSPGAQTGKASKVTEDMR